jgi:hypothetical protein
VKAALVAALAAAAGGATMQMGHGLGPYRIGMERHVYPGLVRTVRHPQNDKGGCSGSFDLDSFVDVYPGLRLGYIFSYPAHKTYLDVIQTTRNGDRSAVGFTIGRSTLRDVRRRYPHLRVRRRRGGSAITLVHPTGYEVGEQLQYAFDAQGVLRALETDVGGC